jgi:high affinity sulfate transporter 1
MTRALLSFREVVPFGITSLRGAVDALLAYSRSVVYNAHHTLDGVYILEWIFARDTEGVWHWKYTRSMLLRDAISACVVASVLVPQSMSYALLVGVPVQYGLYSAVVPTFMYALFTSVSCNQYGIVAPTSILANGIVSGLTGLTDGLHGTPLDNERFIKTQIQLAFACGIVFTLMLLLRLSWVANMLSQPVLNGFTFGSALIIVASQLKDLFNIPSPGAPRDFGTRISLAFQYIGQANPVAAGLGAISLLILLFAKDIKIRGHSLPRLTPIPLIVLLIGIILSWGFDLGGKYKVKTIGTIPTTLPTFTAPFTSDASGSADFVAILPNSILLSIVGFVQTLGVGYTFAKRRNETLLPWRELLGSAMAHLFGASFSAMTVSGSITRSAVAFDAGVATPFSGLIVGSFILISIKFLTPYLQYLPMCILAAVVTASTRNLLQLGDMAHFWHGKKTDFAQMLVTIVGLLVLDIQNGLFAGIGFSFLLVLYRAFQPRLVEVARLPGTQCWVACSRFPEARRDKGINVFRLDGELCFGNVHNVEEKLTQILAEATAEDSLSSSTALKNSMSTKLIDTKLATDIVASTAAAESSEVFSTHGGPPSPILSSSKIPHGVKFRSVFALAGEDENADIPLITAPISVLRRRGIGGGGNSSTTTPEPDSILIANPPPPLLQATLQSPPLASLSSSKVQRNASGSHAHVVIFDCSRVIDVDASGARAINEISALFRKRGVPLLLAALPGPVRDTLERYGVDKEKDEDNEESTALLSQPPTAATATGATAAGAMTTTTTVTTTNNNVLQLNVVPEPTEVVYLRYTRYLTVSAAVAAAELFLANAEEM